MGPEKRGWSLGVASSWAMAAVVIGGVSAGATSPGAASTDVAFAAVVEPISDELAREMTGVSWHPGCPVAIADLRLLTMDHWGFDDQPHRGELVVHEDVADDIVGAFDQLFAARFPILQMQRIELYGGDDEQSMAADNTSAFNCREITGGGAYSVHSWGKAVDINPLENPYVKDGLVLPPAGAAYLDRDEHRPGMIGDGDVVVQAFAGIGFIWGGNWDRLKDYQHFEVTDPTAGSPDSGGVCPRYTDNPRQYPVTVCERGLAVENVQAALVQGGYDIEIDGYFGPATLAAVRQFQSDRGLDVDGLVGPLTWQALLEGSVIGSDEDGNGGVEPWEIPATPQAPGCSVRPPSSDGWSGADGEIIDAATGVLETGPFNEFLGTAAPPVSTSPCDAARVLLRLDQPRGDGETVVVSVEPEHAANATVTVTFEHLADDSVDAVRFVLRFEDQGNGTIQLASGTWSQRCQPNRGHQEFSTELCV